MGAVPGWTWKSEAAAGDNVFAGALGGVAAGGALALDSAGAFGTVAFAWLAAPLVEAGWIAPSMVGAAWLAFPLLTVGCLLLLVCKFGKVVWGVGTMGAVVELLASAEEATGATGSVFTWFAIVGAGGGGEALCWTGAATLGGVAFLLGASLCVGISRLIGAAPLGSGEGAGGGCCGFAGTGGIIAGACCGFATGGCEGNGQDALGGALGGAEGFAQTGVFFAPAVATSTLMGIPVLRAAGTAGIVSARWEGRAFLSTCSSTGVFGVLTTSKELVEGPRTGVAFLRHQHVLYNVYNIHHVHNKSCFSHIKDQATWWAPYPQKIKSPGPIPVMVPHMEMAIPVA